MKSILTIIVTSVTGVLGAQAPINFVSELTLLNNVIRQHHYSPRSIDDGFSREVFEDLLTKLDPDRLYFTKKDLMPLFEYETKLDELVTQRNTKFLEAIVPIYQRSLERSRNTIETVLSKPFDFQVDESLVVSKNMLWANDDAENMEQWRKTLKFRTLERLYRFTHEGQRQFAPDQEVSARERLKSIELQSVDRALNHEYGIRELVSVQLLRAIAGVFDAHTSYLSGMGAQNFMRSLSTDSFSFGLTITEDELGGVTISHLVPGGPAWNSGELHLGDEIVKVKVDNDTEFVDVAGLGLDAVGEIIDQATVSMVITVRDQSGIEHSVMLRREKVHAEENVVKSFVLKGEKTIGYIVLPGFYTIWGDEEGSRCANDVAKEILKLRKENIEGIVLDVRYNGGGSMQEAMAMAGIFIEEGSLGIVRDRQDQLASVKDPNRGSVWDGPMVLLVNGQSASASEFLAAALQDYNRAIIVGSTTFGKATGQGIVSLAPNSSGRRSGGIIDYNHGFLNVTEIKVYRVTGKTVQCLGVTPDIKLPDYVSYLNIKESTMRHRLPPDSVVKNTYFRPLPELPLAELVARSRERVDASEQFKAVEALGKQLGERAKLEQRAVSLKWSNDLSEVNSILGYHRFNTELTLATNPAFTASSLSSEIERMKIDGHLRDFNDGWVKKLTLDIYVDEAFRILCDYISISTK